MYGDILTPPLDDYLKQSQAFEKLHYYIDALTLSNKKLNKKKLAKMTGIGYSTLCRKLLENDLKCHEMTRIIEALIKQRKETSQ